MTYLDEGNDYRIMTREEFKKLYEVLKDANPGEYEYDGDIISTHIYKGIWDNIICEDKTEGKDSWCVCYELRNASGQLWEHLVLYLRGKYLAIVDEVLQAAG